MEVFGDTRHRLSHNIYNSTEVSSTASVKCASKSPRVKYAHCSRRRRFTQNITVDDLVLAQVARARFRRRSRLAAVGTTVFTTVGIGIRIAFGIGIRPAVGIGIRIGIGTTVVPVHRNVPAALASLAPAVGRVGVPDKASLAVHATLAAVRISFAVEISFDVHTSFAVRAPLGLPDGVALAATSRSRHRARSASDEGPTASAANFAAGLARDAAGGDLVSAGGKSQIDDGASDHGQMECKLKNEKIGP